MTVSPTAKCAVMCSDQPVFYCPRAPRVDLAFQLATDSPSGDDRGA